MEKPPEDPRVRFAAERTLLAWIRTGVALMAFGFVVARFGLFLRMIQAAHEQTANRASLWLGCALVAIGAVVQLLSGAEYMRVLKRLDRGEAYTPPRLSLGVCVAAMMAAFGAAMFAYLLANA